MELHAIGVRADMMTEHAREELLVTEAIEERFVVGSPHVPGIFHRFVADRQARVA
jgi:hypothetical protein